MLELICKYMTIWQLDSRCIALLNQLTESETAVSIPALARFFNVSIRSVYYDLSKINDWLVAQDLMTIYIERNRGIFLTKLQSDKIKYLLGNVDKQNYYILSPKERQRIQICTLLSTNKPIFIEKLCTICDVSRNTTFSDLKVVRQKLNRYGLELIYDVQKGYEVCGSLFTQRAVFLYYYAQLVTLLEQYPRLKESELPFYNKREIEVYVKCLNEIELSLDTCYVDGMIFCLASLITVILERNDALDISALDINDIIPTHEYQIVQQKLSNLPDHEKIYIAMHLLGSRVQIKSLDEFKIEPLLVRSIASNLVTEFERLAAVVFEDKSELIRLISSHLSMSIYRYKYGIQIGNPLMNDIITSYPDLFELTLKASRVLKDSLRLPIPDSEIAYITMHFGGYLQHNKHRNQELLVLLVCPNGISTATILRGEVESLHPNLKVKNIVGVEDVDKALIGCDFIISTVDLNASIPVIKVRPIITEEDRLRILSRVVKSNQFKQINGSIGLESIMNITSNYIQGEDLADLRRDLSKLFDTNSINTNPVRETSLRLQDVLKSERIQTIDTIDTWEHAIEYACLPLIQDKSIELSYVKAMIDNVNRFGPYIVIGQNIALAHALPQNGVNSLSAALLRIEKPINFKDRLVSLVFVLAPIDKNSHLGIMKDFMTLVSDTQLIEQLKQCDKAAIYEVIRLNKSTKGVSLYDD